MHMQVELGLSFTQTLLQVSINHISKYLSSIYKYDCSLLNKAASVVILHDLPQTSNQTVNPMYIE